MVGSSPEGHRRGGGAGPPTTAPAQQADTSPAQTPPGTPSSPPPLLAVQRLQPAQPENFRTRPSKSENPFLGLSPMLSGHPTEDWLFIDPQILWWRLVQNRYSMLTLPLPLQAVQRLDKPYFSCMRTNGTASLAAVKTSHVLRTCKQRSHTVNNQHKSPVSVVQALKRAPGLGLLLVVGLLTQQLISDARQIAMHLSSAPG